MKAICLVFIILIAAGCSGFRNNNLNSVLWMQTSAEYRANTLQTYHNATQNLSAALQDSGWTAALEQNDNYRNLPPAIVLDVDETVLDNSPYQAQMVQKSSEFTIDSWDAWVGQSMARAVPGAVEFLNNASGMGVTVFFVTNRECRQRGANGAGCPQHAETLANLQAVGISAIGEDQLLIKKQREDWGSEKKSRREHIAQNYRIVMLFGDDFGDFLPNVKSKITPAERAELVDNHSDKWGSKWFLLPNPSYGSWQRVLPAPAEGNLRTH